MTTISVFDIQKQHLIVKIKEIIDYTKQNYEISIFSLRELYIDINTVERLKSPTNDHDLFNLQELFKKYSMDCIEQ